jgi:hypothetical protein
VQALEARHFIDAWRAPRRPDVEHDHLVAIVVEGLHSPVAVEGRGPKVRGLRAHFDRKELVAHRVRPGTDHDGDQRDDAQNHHPLLPGGHELTRVLRTRSATPRSRTADHVR